jgi:hypothetical protein
MGGIAGLAAALVEGGFAVDPGALVGRFPFRFEFSGFILVRTPPLEASDAKGEFTFNASRHATEISRNGRRDAPTRRVRYGRTSLPDPKKQAAQFLQRPGWQCFRLSREGVD